MRHIVLMVYVENVLNYYIQMDFMGSACLLLLHGSVLNFLSICWWMADNQGQLISKDSADRFAVFVLSWAILF